MVVASSSIYINVSVDRTFDYLVDLDRHLEWSGKLSFGLERIEIVTPGPLKVGSIFKSTGHRSSGAGVEDTSTITEFDLHSRLAWKTISSGAGQQNTFHWVYTFEAQDDGTKLTYYLMERNFRPKPFPLWFPPLLWLVDRKVFGREMSIGLKRIKESLESYTLNANP